MDFKQPYSNISNTEYAYMYFMESVYVVGVIENIDQVIVVKFI